MAEKVKLTKKETSRPTIFHLSLNSELVERLRKQAEYEHRSITNLIRHACYKYLESIEKEE